MSLRDICFGDCGGAMGELLDANLEQAYLQQDARLQAAVGSGLVVDQGRWNELELAYQDAVDVGDDGAAWAAVTDLTQFADGVTGSKSSETTSSGKFTSSGRNVTVAPMTITVPSGGSSSGSAAAWILALVAGGAVFAASRRKRSHAV